MKLKVILVSLIILSVIPLYPPQQAFGAEIIHYYEENNTCTNTTANDSVVLTVTDETDFSFIDGRSYLIVAKGEFTGDSTAENVEMFLQHGTSDFEGGRMIIEPNTALSTGSCGANAEYFDYFFFVVWEPVGATQAGEDIVLIADNLQSSAVYEYDQASIFVMEISESLTEDTGSGGDWISNTQTANSALGTSWNTPNDATITFTPTTNNAEWLIMCTTTIDTASAIILHLSRLNAITDSVTMEFGEMEGEDVGNDQYVQTGIFLTTIENSAHTFECEAQSEASASGTRLYNAIFALNLDDAFESSTIVSTLGEGSLPNSLTEIETIDHTPVTTGDTWILASAVIRNGNSAECSECRLQVDDVDQPTGNSGGSEPNTLWENNDKTSWVEQTVLSLDTSTHNIDFDATDDGTSGSFASVKHIMALSMELDTTVDNFKTIENPLTLTDITEFDVSIIIEDPLTWTDIISAGLSRQTNPVDQITWTDIITELQLFAEQITGGGGTTVDSGDPTPIDPDSDGDGIIDSVDQCPLEIGTIANNGCPSIILPPLLDFDFDIPIGFNELDVVDDFIILETEFPQPQVEDIAIRWLSNMPITITSVIIGESPFEIQIANIPLTIGDESFGFTQARLLYTVQEPDKVCGDTFSFDCIDEVTYQIPIKISGVSDGNTIIADGTITIDNSGRFNPYWLLLLTLLVIPMIALILRKKSNARPELNTIFKFTSVKTNLRPLPKSKSQKSGTTKKSLKLTQTRSRVELKKSTAEKKFRSGTTKRLLRGEK